MDADSSDTVNNQLTSSDTVSLSHMQSSTTSSSSSSIHSIWSQVAASRHSSPTDDEVPLSGCSNTSSSSLGSASSCSTFSRTQCDGSSMNSAICADTAPAGRDANSTASSSNVAFIHSDSSLASGVQEKSKYNNHAWTVIDDDSDDDADIVWSPWQHTDNTPTPAAVSATNCKKRKKTAVNPVVYSSGGDDDGDGDNNPVSATNCKKHKKTAVNPVIYSSDDDDDDRKSMSKRRRFTRSSTSALTNSETTISDVNANKVHSNDKAIDEWTGLLIVTY